MWTSRGRNAYQQGVKGWPLKAERPGEWEGSKRTQSEKNCASFLSPMHSMLNTAMKLNFKGSNHKRLRVDTLIA